jgi:formylmethanofuran dehydrogenase subunit E
MNYRTKKSDAFGSRLSQMGLRPSGVTAFSGTRHCSHCKEQRSLPDSKTIKGRWVCRFCVPAMAGKAEA